MRGIAVALFATACALGSDGAHAQATLAAAPLLMPFSAGRAGAPAPKGWEVLRLTDRKRLTAYDLVADHGVVVLHAVADASASALAHRTAFDVRAAPMIEWRWRIDRLIEGADNRVAAREDSPVRLMFEFDGDKSKLPLRDRAVFMMSSAASGHELPYATLMYIWANTLPVGTVVPNPHTRRIMMVVAASGPAEVRSWQTLRRNILDDFVRAFGEQPGRLTAVGVLTDTDNTGAQVEAWYGDIQFAPAER
jgi:hypothetical protein